MKTTTSEKSRHILLRAEPGDVLPDALLAALREQAVVGGWLRATGVIEDVELRAFDPAAQGLASVRRIAGPVQVVALEGSVGIAGGELSVGLSAVLARESDRGIDALAGEVTSARVVALEALVIAIDDVAVGRALDASGLWMLEAGGSTPRRAAAPSAENKPDRERPAEREARREPPAAWGEAIAASADAPSPQAVRAPTPRAAQAAANAAMGTAVIPPRPVRIERPVDPDIGFPEAGDEVEHFAFGRCEVMKSDGDRLHLRVGRDGRIKEIALEMLKVQRLGVSEEGRRRFRLDRRM